MAKGIVCKVWNIQGKTATKGASSQIRDSVEYILNDEKVDFSLSMPNSIFENSASQIERECHYIENDVKTVQGAFVGTRNLLSSDIKEAVAEMMSVKKFYQKLDGRAALHGIISLAEDESDVANAPALMSLCEEVMAEVFPNHQVIFAVHTNTDDLHIHFIVNSVGLDGKKIHQDDKFMKNVLHPCVNKYAKKYGFTPNEKWEKKNEPEHSRYVGNKIILRDKIDRAIEKSDSFDDFIDNLKEEKLIVNVGVHISLRTEEMKKPIRTHNLGPNYTKDAIIERIHTRKNAFESVKMSTVTADISKSEIFQPEYSTMKRYKSMNEDEREYVLKQLRLGKNPWRIHKKVNWQLNEIANDLNKESRVFEYVKSYSKDGTLESAVSTILEAKKTISSDKKRIKEQIRSYKPIIDIYNEMLEIERQAYLYEHENVEEFRPEFEKYRELTRRLKEGYNKEIDEVAAFLQECDDRFLYAEGQLRELSSEYREIKAYAKEHGKNLNGTITLADQIGLSEARQDAKYGLFEADSYYLVSKSSDVMMRVIKTPSVDEKGRTIETVSLTLTNRYGEIIESYDTANGMSGYYEFLNRAEHEYGLTGTTRVSSASVAREYMSYSIEEAVKPKAEAVKNDNVSEKRYSFTQAINLQSVKNEDGFHVILNAENPSYMAVIHSSNHEIVARVIDSTGKTCDEIKFPSLRDRDHGGYTIISAMQRDYGFTDEMVAYSNIDDAKRRIEAESQEKKEKRQKARL